jgi:hypothetical protein
MQHLSWLSANPVAATEFSNRSGPSALPEICSRSKAHVIPACYAGSAAWLRLSAPP